MPVLALPLICCLASGKSLDISVDPFSILPFVCLAHLDGELFREGACLPSQWVLLDHLATGKDFCLALVARGQLMSRSRRAHGLAWKQSWRSWNDV